MGWERGVCDAGKGRDWAAPAGQCLGALFEVLDTHPGHAALGRVGVQDRHPPLPAGTAPGPQPSRRAGALQSGTEPQPCTLPPAAGRGGLSSLPEQPSATAGRTACPGAASSLPAMSSRTRPQRHPGAGGQRRGTPPSRRLGAGEMPVEPWCGMRSRAWPLRGG